MTIVLTGDKNLLSLLPPEDARLVLLALFSEDGDLPEMTPLANMAYTSMTVKGTQANHNKPATCKNIDLLEQRFDQFWSVYPRKIGKEAARKAWRRIKPTADHLEKILAAVKKAKGSYQWQKDNGQYIPHPATWLNQGRWDDEIQPGFGRINSKCSNLGSYQQREYDSEYLDQFVSSEFGNSTNEHVNKGYF